MRFIATTGLFLSLLATGCGESASPLGRDDLVQLMQEVVTAQNAGDTARYVALMRQFVPTRAELRELLRTGPATEEFVRKYQGATVEDGARDKLVAGQQGVPKTTRTDVFVHAATTEELAAYQRGTVAFAEFPGGMRRFASLVAAPARIWYAVELRDPGADSGTRIAAFTALRDRFVLVPKPWRALPEEDAAAPDPSEPK